MRTHHLKLFLTFTLVLLSALPMLAATQNATVYGTVYNASGNSEAGITVSLANPSLGFQRTTTTGSDGSYNFAEVPPAEGYVLTAMRGSQIIDIRSGIVVNVGDERVIFPPLREQVTVAAAKPVAKAAEAGGVQLETVATSISGVITGEQLRTLPLYNRTFLALGGLTPNVHDLGAGNELAGVSFSIAGGRGASNSFLLDGADNVASSTNQAVPFQVNDSIQEFRLTSATAPAEYGRNRAGTVNIVTRRGGNAFHGSAYGYFANDALNADRPLSVYNGTTFAQAASFAGTVPAAGYFNPGPLTYNQYVVSAQTAGYCTDAGAATCNSIFDPAAILAGNNRFKNSFDSKQFGVSSGGALIKDKLFVFGSYEGTRIDNPNSVFERVPSQFDKTYAPYGVAPNFLPNDPNYTTAQQVLALYPNANVVAVPGVLEFYRGEAPNYTNVHNFLVRTDIVPSEKDSITVRFVLQKLNQLHDDTLPATSSYPGNGAYRDALNQNFNVNYSHALAENILNEFRVGYNRFNVRETAQDASFDATPIFGYSELPTFLLNGLDARYSGGANGVDAGAYSGWVNFILGSSPLAPTLDNKFPFARIGAPISAPTSRIDTTIFVGDSVSWTAGKHNIKFGVDVRRLGNKYFDGGVTRGWVFSGNIGEFTADSATEFLGWAYSWPTFDFAQRQTEPYTGNFATWSAAGYLQDAWRVSPRVTINFGLRFERVGSPAGDANRIWNFDPVAGGLVSASTGEVVDPYGEPCSPTAPYLGMTQYLQLAFGYTAFNFPCTSTGNRAFGRSRNAAAPRIGLAWDLTGDSKTVLRLGFGLYYDQVPTDSYAKLMYNRPITTSNGLYGQTLDFFSGYCVGALQCGTGNSILDFGAIANTVGPFAWTSFPLGIYSRDQAHQDLPRTYQAMATIQRQLAHNLALEVGYVGALGRDLPVVYNSNFPNEFGNFGTAATNQIMSFFPVWTMTNRGSSSYHSLMARLRLADFHGLRLNASYSWSKSLDNASSSIYPATAMPLVNVTLASLFSRFDFTTYCLFDPTYQYCHFIPAGAPIQAPTIDLTPAAVTTTGQGLPLVSRYLIPQDPTDFLSNDFGASDFDSRHRLTFDYTWELPFKSQSPFLKNWVLSGIFTAQSGQPFTIFSGPMAGEVTQRVSATGPVSINPTNPNAAISLTNLALPFTNCEAAVTYPESPFMPNNVNVCRGDTRRNAFVGDKFINMNFAVQKGFQVFGEGRMLIFRAEIFNLFNRANYYNPISVVSTDGLTLNPDFGKIKSAHDPRQIQFAVRFSW
jgi:hypothetical protein